MHVGSYRSALFGPLNLKKSLPKYTIEDRKVLDKRVHTNPKFKSIQPRTDSGFNARKKEVLQKEINKYFKITSSETFSRITLSDFVQLIISDSHENNKKLNTFLYQHEEKNEEDIVPENSTVAPCYLLVDVRSPTEFSKSHIVGAVNHEYAKLGRSVNWESKELIRYRNHPDWVIILYDMSENIAPDYAATLIHRGYENVFMLSGGIKLATDKFGSPLVVTKSDQESDNVINDYWTLRNESVPLNVCEEFAHQLTDIILPPLSTKGSAAEKWYATCGSIAPSEVGTSRSSVSTNHRAPRSKSLINEKTKAWR